ncbi:MAG: VOC family protein [Cytophagales bacterium]|nr:MAG: VOC family protein [Cytophagales bacterium]
MTFNYHHMNLCTEDVQRTSAFYQSVFGLTRVTDDEHKLAGEDTADRFTGAVDFLTDGTVEFHITRKDANLGFRMKQFINPVERGHFCFRTDDIEGFKKRLEEQGIPYADYGKWALAGWYQIFFHDPDGNIIEVHQTGL